MALIQYQTQQLPSIRDVLGEFFTPDYQYLNQSKYRVPKLKIPRSKVTKNVVQNFNRKFVCKWDNKDHQKCIEEFASAITLLNHIVSNHTMKNSCNSQESLTCKWRNCHKQFGRRCNLAMHLQTHINTSSLTCDTCGKTYSSKQYLRKHTIKIHNSPYL